MQTKQELLAQLKQEKNAAVLAHYYAPPEVQQAADYVGDSFYLSKVATTIPQTTLVFAGVRFMGESAKALNPEKTVLMPDFSADCPMAHMCTAETIAQARATYEDLAVVCYINSTAELKCLVDVCVTSANAVKVVRALPQKHILFVPDQNLGHFVAQQIPEKQFIYNNGYCPIHNAVTAQHIQQAKAAHPEAPVLAHPECSQEVLALTDYIGSTTGIINQAKDNPADSFIICTEEGVLYELQRQCPDKTFYPAMEQFVCADMKRNTLDGLIHCLQHGTGEVHMTEEQIARACQPLAEMLRLAQ